MGKIPGTTHCPTPPHTHSQPNQYSNAEALNNNSNRALKRHSDLEHDYKAALNGSDIPEESPEQRTGSAL